METRLLIVGSAKTKDIKRRRPRIRLSGFWLNEIGFKPDSLISIMYESNTINLRLVGTGMETYQNLVKGILKRNHGLLQVKNEVSNNKKTPHLEVKGYWVEDLGFKVGDVILVQSEFGVINIQLLDLEKVGIKNNRAFDPSMSSSII
ncbi:MAG: hypothetical protein Q8920_09435 [Bacillota bacterium]|nr:hypothetical protein [Bacillota bacterium]